MSITITVPNDDHVALRAMAKALEEIAVARGAKSGNTLDEIGPAFNSHQHVFMQHLSEATGVPEHMLRGEPDTTSQQVKSLEIPAEANGATYETDLGSDNPVPVCMADSTNTPWDERIHSASKALNADGTWRLRRKPKDIDEAEWSALVESVKNELMGVKIVSEETIQQIEELVSEPVAPTEALKQLMTPEPPVTPPGDDFHTDAGVVTEQTVAGIPPIPVPPPVVVPPVPHTIPVTVEVVNDEQWDFPKLMKFLTERHGKIDVPTVNQLLAVDGLAALTDLNAHPDKIGPFVARVKAHLGE